MGSGPRVAIPLTYGLSVRYLVSTGLLAQLAEICDPIVAIGWEDEQLAARLAQAGATATRLPDPHQDHQFRRIERLIDAARPQPSPTGDGAKVDPRRCRSGGPDSVRLATGRSPEARSQASETVAVRAHTTWPTTQHGSRSIGSMQC
jgi:hypothetical protein